MKLRKFLSLSPFQKQKVIEEISQRSFYPFYKVKRALKMVDAKSWELMSIEDKEDVLNYLSVISDRVEF